MARRRNTCPWRTLPCPWLPVPFSRRWTHLPPPPNVIFSLLTLKKRPSVRGGGAGSCTELHPHLEEHSMWIMADGENTESCGGDSFTLEGGCSVRRPFQACLGGGTQEFERQPNSTRQRGAHPGQFLLQPFWSVQSMANFVHVALVRPVMVIPIC